MEGNCALGLLQPCLLVDLLQMELNGERLLRSVCFCLRRGADLIAREDDVFVL